MANEQKTTNAQQAQNKSTRIAVNVIALVMVIAISFAAGFGVSKLVSDRHDKDGRPDLEEMRQMGRQRGIQRPSRNGSNGNDPNGDNQYKTPSRPQKKDTKDSSSES